MTLPRRPWDTVAAMRRWYEGWTSTIRVGSDRAACGKTARVSDAVPAAAMVCAADPNSGAADLLMRRMTVLQIDPDELAKVEWFALLEMQELCAMCESPIQCARALDDEVADPAWQDWRDYCPNATRLTVLSMLCSLQPRGLAGNARTETSG